jgi:sec-independent protein translocase protein TatA
MLLSVLLLFGGLGTGEIILIALVVLLLFGGKKIPELMKGLGKGVKSFKEGMAGLEDEINKPHQPDPPKEPEKDKPPEKAG